MKRTAICWLTVLIALITATCSGHAELANRWFFVGGTNPARAQSIQKLKGLIETASTHGLNGMVLTAGLDRLDLVSEEYLRGLQEIKQICDENKIEIIPVVFSAGYGGSILAHNPNLAAGLPVEGALFAAHGGQARFVPDPEVSVVNGGFEKINNGRVAGFTHTEPLGGVIQIDKTEYREGSQSLRFENFGEHDRNAAELKQTVRVSPHRCYVVSCWVKTEDLNPGRRFRIEVNGGGRLVGEYIPRWGATNQWQHLVLGFNSWNAEELEITVGAPGARSGKLWIDGLALKEVGLTNVLRRPGTPVTVKSESSGTVYEEGRDYARIEDPELNCRFEHEGPSIKLLDGGRIADGERLRVDYYHGFMSVKGKGQKTICMSEPEVYKIWREQVRLMVKYLDIKKYFLDMDEIRAGGTCKACTDRHISLGQILGECAARQYQLIQQECPGGEAFIWSDMFDPNHNAGETYHGQNYYYQTSGLYTGSWKYIPRELVIVCWWDRMMDKSLPFFSGLGHRTLAAAYYDADNLDNTRAWLKALDNTQGATGIMYTTWESKYGLLADFGDLVSGHQ